jgi:hypothetical protein
LIRLIDLWENASILFVRLFHIKLIVLFSSTGKLIIRPIITFLALAFIFLYASRWDGIWYIFTFDADMIELDGA